jgi:hypothetical protein
VKRLAFMAIGIAATAATVPALAGDLGSERPTTSSWCEQHADWWADAAVGRHVGLSLGTGATTDREVVSGYACYDARLPGFGRRGELLNAYWDPEYGTVGSSCVRQGHEALVSCKRNAVSLPVEATTPVTHEDEPWWLDLFGVGLDYAYEGGRVKAAVHVRQHCVEGACAGLDPQRVGAGPTARVRLSGYECRPDARSACTRTEAGDQVQVGENGAPSLVTVNDLRFVSIVSCRGLSLTSRSGC